MTTNYQSVQLVDNGNRGREYSFVWTLKPNEKQTQGTLTVSVDAKTGSVTENWAKHDREVRSVESG